MAVLGTIISSADPRQLTAHACSVTNRIRWCHALKSMCSQTADVAQTSRCLRVFRLEYRVICPIENRCECNWSVVTYYRNDSHVKRAQWGNVRCIRRDAWRHASMRQSSDSGVKKRRWGSWSLSIHRFSKIFDWQFGSFYCDFRE